MSATPNGGPIADLSYRGYDGPLESPRMRWWVIARQGIKLAIKRKGLWMVMIGSAWYYLVMLVVLFFVQQVLSSNPMGEAPVMAFMKRLVWKDQFLHGFSYAQLPLLAVTIMLGSGAIANDNRSKALMVYLSKPADKTDYLLGKWIGIALPIWLTLLVPTVVFYGYGALSFRQYGFIVDDPWLFPKLMAILPLAAFMHASLMIGVSSLFDQGRVAGATYAGIYFLTNFFTVLMGAAWNGSRGEGPAIVKTLYYGSLDGLLIGSFKALMGTSGTPPFGIEARRVIAIDPPPTFLVLGIVVLLSAASLALAWRKIRAVEVIGG